MNLRRDLRYALRLLIRHRTFAAAAVAVIALGIGLTTAVFTVVRGVLLPPLPYRDPARLVLLRADAPGFTHRPALTGAEFHALRRRTDLFITVVVVLGTIAAVATALPAIRAVRVDPMLALRAD